MPIPLFIIACILFALIIITTIGLCIAASLYINDSHKRRNCNIYDRTNRYWKKRNLKHFFSFNSVYLKFSTFYYFYKMVLQRIVGYSFFFSFFVLEICNSLLSCKSLFSFYVIKFNRSKNYFSYCHLLHPFSTYLWCIKSHLAKWN